MTDAPENREESEGSSSGEKAARGGIRLFAVLAAVCVVVALCAAGYAVWLSTQAQNAAQKQAVSTVQDNHKSNKEQPTRQPTSDTDNTPANPVNFAALVQEAPDVCAWLEVPGTNVNVAVVQNPTDDSYYLDHAADGSYSPVGAAFIELQNASDFTDNVTLIYGHNISGGAMFSTLELFQDEAFFAEHDRFYLYTPGHVLTYEIVSAYLYDNRHILNSFDFSDAGVVRDYFDFLVYPQTMSANVREGAFVADGSRVVQLSTCPDGALSLSARYLVTGVLVDDQLTR